MSGWSCYVNDFEAPQQGAFFIVRKIEIDVFDDIIKITHILFNKDRLQGAIKYVYAECRNYHNRDGNTLR